MNMLSSLKFSYISSFNLFFLFSFESYSCEEVKKLPPSAFQLPSSSTIAMVFLKPDTIARMASLLHSYLF